MREPRRPDPDILSIQRKRRRERRCLRCGSRSGRPALCATCAGTLRYCPRCERVYPEPQACARVAATRPTIYCRACQICARYGSGPTAEEDAARRRALNHPLLARVIWHYRQGMPIRDIAAALDVPLGRIKALMSHARRTGRWPENLRRQKGR